MARAYCVEKFEPGVRLEESNQRRSSKTDREKRRRTGRPASARGEPALTFSQSAGLLSLHTNLRGYLSICLLGNISRGDVTCWTSQGGGNSVPLPLATSSPPSRLHFLLLSNFSGGARSGGQGGGFPGRLMLLTPQPAAVLVVQSTSQVLPSVYANTVRGLWVLQWLHSV